MPGVIDGFPDGWINNEVEDSSTRTCVTASGYDSFWSSCLAGYAELPRGPVKIGPTLGLCRQGQRGSVVGKIPSSSRLPPRLLDALPAWLEIRRRRPLRTSSCRCATMVPASFAHTFNISHKILLNIAGF
jgi:hypothetical protein